MYIPKQKTGLTTCGATGLIILAGVIFAEISPWWLIVGGFFILAGIGLEADTERK